MDYSEVRINAWNAFLYSKNTSSLSPLSFLDNEVFFREHAVKYFSSTMTWAAHSDTAFTECLTECLFIRRLRSMNDHKPILWRIVLPVPPLLSFNTPLSFSPGLLLLKMLAPAIILQWRTSLRHL